MDDKYDLLIIFKDGMRKIIRSISSYGLDTKNDMFYFIQDGYKTFVPRECVKFLGRKCAQMKSEMKDKTLNEIRIEYGFPPITGEYKNYLLKKYITGDV